MKTMIKRIFAFAMLALFVMGFAGFALAETENTSVPTESAEATAEPTTEESTEDLAVVCIDDETGKMVQSLYIKHGYTLYYVHTEIEGYPKAGNVTLELEVQEGFEDYAMLNEDATEVIIKPCDSTFYFMITPHVGGETGQVVSVNVNRFYIDFMVVILAAIGIYALVSAIRGKGALFTNEYIKEGKEQEFKKWARICAMIAGIAMIAYAALTIFFSYLSWTTTVGYVLFGLGILSLVAILIISKLLTDKEKKAKGQANTASTGTGRGSAAAFEFDGTEPTIDDILAQKEADVNSENAREDN